MIRADMHLKNAIHFEKLARTCTDPTLAAEYHIKALKELGKGLHPLQDISAHKDEYVHRYFIGYIIGDPAFCTPIVIYSHLHTDEPDKPGDILVIKTRDIMKQSTIHIIILENSFMVW